MSIELRVTSGARAGVREAFDKSVIAIGRHPMCDLRLDTERDLDVSARHAEIRVVNGVAMLRDVGSSNGTSVNGQPLVGERALFDGDVIQLGGVHGAAVEFRTVDTPAPTAAPAPTLPSRSPAPTSRRDTTARIAEAVQEHTGRLRRTVIIFTVAVVVVMAALVWTARRNAQADRATIEQLLTQLQQQNEAIAQLNGSRGAAGLTDEVQRIRHERDSLLAALRAGGDRQAISGRMAELTQRQDAAGSVSRVDYERIADLNSRAVAFIVVQFASGAEGGSGFGVTKDGIIVTNRHVVQENGVVAEKIAVQYDGTKQWLPAHVMKMSTTDDLAFLKVDAPGTYPVVQGVASSGGMKAGAPVAVVGFPLGNATAGMGGAIDTMTARASLAAGFVSKSVPDILQVDAYVAHGSSGSPVFNQRGMVVGVVYGGPTEAAGRIVYCVPSERLIAQLPGEAAGAVKQ